MPLNISDFKWLNRLKIFIAIEKQIRKRYVQWFATVIMDGSMCQ